MTNETTSAQADHAPSDGVETARAFAENTWGALWTDAEWSSLMEFAALATPQAARPVGEDALGAGFNEDAERWCDPDYRARGEENCPACAAGKWGACRAPIEDAALASQPQEATGQGMGDDWRVIRKALALSFDIAPGSNIADIRDAVRKAAAAVDRLATPAPQATDAEAR